MTTPPAEPTRLGGWRLNPPVIASVSRPRRLWRAIARALFR